MFKKLVCVQCPIGCKLNIEISGNDNSILKIDGNKCKRGIDYAQDEIKDPKRILTTSIKVVGGELPLVSVKTDKPISIKYIKIIMNILRSYEVKAPIKRGEIIIQNILDTKANIVATRTVKKSTS
ncbi:MAG: DUF1667 domain-containing protein [Dictyoglomus sp.]|nr:DUF1667 domain-containing protein [Dictyoglomus sp.]MCX7942498.1 DUF1667 domain-containing protein [Dictyoglomaceae bacterium]MDW8188914.1 DUF1667 domain-containing protein [Dictyoglomus sp.]